MEDEKGIGGLQESTDGGDCGACRIQRPRCGLGFLETLSTA